MTSETSTALHPFPGVVSVHGLDRARRREAHVVTELVDRSGGQQTRQRRGRGEGDVGEGSRSVGEKPAKPVHLKVTVDGAHAVDDGDGAVADVHETYDPDADAIVAARRRRLIARRAIPDAIAVDERTDGSREERQRAEQTQAEP